jgi:hydrogenase maturation protein HypF
MSAVALANTPLVRRAIRVRGAVQGVGFRPFVWRLARELALCGEVRNDGEGVSIDVEGAYDAIERFAARLRSDAPGLARVDAVESSECGPVAGRFGFVIAASGGGRVATGIAPDVAVCPDCLAELFAPDDRRYRYPFINCTQCGPRFTITRRLPYDRLHTSMAEFALCARCAAEYGDPASRRFHAQPNACPVCGPRLALLGPDGSAQATEDVVARALARLRGGEILAIKGLGGYHLVCDARDAGAVGRLRARKHREEKPFAVMVANAASAVPLASMDEAARATLAAPERPITLLRKRPACDAMLAGIAPGIAWLGVMLPYTPLQYLLFHEAAGRPHGTHWLDELQPLVLVMTSANPGGEPLVTGESEAVRRLGGIADALVVHDRGIEVRCDDSVVRPVRGATAFIRRARGYTPRPVRLADDGPCVLAVGAWLKNTVCVTRGREALLSQHVGDLDHAATCAALEEVALHLLDVLQVRPEVVAHDLHPDFHSTRFAADFAVEHELPLRAVQHHHAHIAAVAAEHGRKDAVLGLALDGVGLGADGTAWGGELLLVSGAAVRRLGHLRTLALPGGDRAAREPWRMAAAALHALGRSEDIVRRFTHRAAPTVVRMLAKNVQAPPTSSAGRWFDAAAGLLGVREVAAYEGQAAMLLEGLAEQHGPVAPWEGGWRIDAEGVLDLLPLLGHLADCTDAARGAAAFHATLAEALAAWAIAGAQRSGVGAVAFGGGCFMNEVLARDLRLRLAHAGLEVLEARAVPPNDGGLSLGQAAVARVSPPVMREGGGVFAVRGAREGHAGASSATRGTGRA